MAKVSLSTLIDAIENGSFDQGLDRLGNAVYNRRLVLKEKREQEIWDQLEVGTRIRLNNRVRPTYLRGLTGKVVDFRRTRVTLEMDKPLPGKFGLGKGRINRTLICPPNLLEILPQETELKELGKEIANLLNADYKGQA